MAIIDTHQAVKKFIASGFKENQAEAITSVISNIDETVATKADIVRLECKLESDINRLEDKITNNTNWLKTMGVLAIGLLIKIAFF